MWRKRGDRAPGHPEMVVKPVELYIQRGGRHALAVRGRGGKVIKQVSRRQAMKERWGY